jgi:hypothetical protein
MSLSVLEDENPMAQRYVNADTRVPICVSTLIVSARFCPSAFAGAWKRILDSEKYCREEDTSFSATLVLSIIGVDSATASSFTTLEDCCMPKLKPVSVEYAAVSCTVDDVVNAKGVGGV